ncbi:MAG: DUF4160 domain-containing protein [Legionellales bacterium]|nr:DUF4160 domain-containing protein [Legionellales bacterium]
MTPTVFKYKSYRFFFFSREETRKHIHVICEDGEAKFWIEPIVCLSDYFKLSKKQLNELQKIVEEHVNDIIKAWKTHFND